MYIIDEIMSRPCDDLRVRRRELFQAATLVHKREQDDVINSIFLIEALERDNAAANLGMFKDEFIQKIGLTPDVYYGRAVNKGQSWTAVSVFPRGFRTA